MTIGFVPPFSPEQRKSFCDLPHARLVPEAVRAVARIIEGCDVSRFPMPMSLRARIEPSMMVDAFQLTMVVATRVIDRDDALKVIPVYHSFTMILEPLQVEPLEERTHYWLRQSLHQVVRHELEECLLFDGVRRYDPHARETSA